MGDAFMHMNPGIPILTVFQASLTFQVSSSKIDRTSGAPSLSRFSGKKSEFTTWKDMVHTYCAHQDTKYAMTQLEKDYPLPTVAMADFLHSAPEEPALALKSGSQEDARKARFAHMHWRQARHSMANLLNLILPVPFLSTLPSALSLMEPCDVWKALEAMYGISDAGGMIELSKAWARLTASSWKDLGSYFAQLKKLRNDINRKSQALVKKDMVTEDWMCVEVLSQLPSEFWASTISITPEGFTVEQVEQGLRRVFGDKSKKDISQNRDRSGKPSAPVHVKVVQKKRKNQADEASSRSECYYCFGTGHFKAECVTMKKDRDPNRPGAHSSKAKVKFANMVKLKQGKAPAKKQQRSSPPPETSLNINAVLRGSEPDVDQEFPDGTDVPLSECGSMNLDQFEMQDTE